MASFSVCSSAAAASSAVATASLLLLLLQPPQYFCCCCFCCCNRLDTSLAAATMSTPSPPPLFYSIGSHSLSIYGDFLLMMDPESFFPRDAVFLQLDLDVTSRSPYPSRLLRNSTRYAPLELSLRELRRMIHRSPPTPTPDQSVISDAGGDHNAMTLLTRLVETYTLQHMVGRFTPPENARTLYHIRAYLDMSEQEPPGAPVEDMLRKVTYSSGTQISEGMCPICLEDFEDGEEVHLTPCQHPFHLRCLECSLQYKALCPLCRRALP